jgi:endoglucanase
MNLLLAFFETSYHALLLWVMMLAIHSPPAVPPGLGEGYWHTRGNQVLDEHSSPVRIAGINWYGFETANAAPGGLDTQDYRTILDLIKTKGYNTVRIPFSSQMVEYPTVPAFIKFRNHNGDINSGLQGLTSLQVLDRIVDYAGSQGLKIILDNHRSEPGDGPEANGLWYAPAYSEAAWIADWKMLARRYDGNPTVIGFDLRNEPHNANSAGACWSCGGPNDWHLAAQRAGNSVLSVNPRLLIFVEGVDEFENSFYWWGGNLQGVRTAPVRLDVPHQLIYSAHDYGPSESGQPWFTPGLSASTLNDVWTRNWAYISKEGIAPVWLGEFGTPPLTPDSSAPADAMEAVWFHSIIQFLAQDNRIGWSYWALNSEDRNGLVNSTYSAFNGSSERQQALATIQSPLGIKGTSLKLAPISTVSAKQQSTTVVPIHHKQVPLPAPAIAPARIPTPPTTDAPVEHATDSTLQAVSCSVTYSNQNDWKQGFTAAIVLHNSGAKPIQGWRLTWSFPGDQHIQELWNGTVTQTGTAVAISNVSWNAIIPANGDLAGIGFNAAYTGANSNPTQFYLNGVPCR